MSWPRKNQRAPMGFLRARISPESEADICARVERGETHTSIARLHGIDRRTVVDVWRRVRRCEPPKRKTV